MCASFRSGELVARQSPLRSRGWLPTALPWLLAGQACARLGYDPPPPVDEVVGGTPVLTSGAAPDGRTPARDASAEAGPTPSDATTPDARWAEPDAAPDASAAPPPARFASCAELPPLLAEPSLDGELEPGLGESLVAPVGWSGSGEVPSGNTLTLAAGWRADGLYFHLRVTDPDRNPAAPTDAVWAGDGVELYVDHDAVFADSGAYDDPGTRQLVFAAPDSDALPAGRSEVYITGALAGSVDSASWVSVPIAGGYVVEVWVGASALGLDEWALSAGSSVGFDLGHNVSAPVADAGVQGSRLGQYFLQIGSEPDATRFPFYKSGPFCAPTLVP